MRHFPAAIEIARPHNMLAAAACIAAGYYLAGGHGFENILYPMIIGGLTAGCGNIINDYYDVDIDSINKPRRPIPSGRLSAGCALNIYIFCSVVVTALAVALLPVPLLVLVLVWEILLHLYARKAKRMPLVGNILVACVASSAFLAGAATAQNAGAAVFPFVFAFFFIMGRELVKEAEDLEGDRSAGAETIAVKIGIDKTVFIASLFLIMCAIIAPVPSFVNVYGRTYLLLMEFTVVPGLLAASYLVLRNPTRTVLNRVSWILKGEMFLGIVAMALARS
jgi:geranylgeranylglycerol-phosphate geranylgeranyltransferase